MMSSNLIHVKHREQPCVESVQYKINSLALPCQEADLKT